MLITTIGQVPSDDKWDFFLSQLFFSDRKSIIVHILPDLHVNRCIFRNLDSPNTNYSCFLILSHKRRGNSFFVRLLKLLQLSLIYNIQILFLLFHIFTLLAIILFQYLFFTFTFAYFIFTLATTPWRSRIFIYFDLFVLVIPEVSTILVIIVIVHLYYA